MRGASEVGRWAVRLTAAALFAVLLLTGIHGSASLAAPAGAIAASVASIGAALQHSSGCGAQRDGHGDSVKALRGQALEEPPERGAGTDLPPVVAADQPASVAEIGSLPVAEPCHVLTPVPAGHHQGRAPPA